MGFRRFPEAAQTCLHVFVVARNRSDEVLWEKMECVGWVASVKTGQNTKPSSLLQTLSCR